MLIFTVRRLSSSLAVLSWLVLFGTAAAGQTAPAKPERPTESQDDVVRVDTALVQTDVMVFDKKGRFVEGLRPEQFELKIDKKPQTISFFERVVASGLRGEKTAQPNSGADSPTNPAPRVTTAGGRVVIFFVDDLHLAPASLVRTREALNQFIDQGIGDKDQVAITSPSGQIGFLQQFTGDKAALRSAVARLNYRSNTKMEMDKPPMSEYIALKIREGDEQALAYYAQEIQKQNCYKVNGELVCMVSPQSAMMLAKTRAQEIVTMAAPETDNTLRLLEGLMRSAAHLPGRKIVFVISDGFYLSDAKTGSRDKIKKITDAAGRAGVVIYTLDARGLINEGIDVTNNRPIDSKGLLSGSTIGETAASQDGLNALARDTGGRPFRNTNAPMREFVDTVLDETANYYLLAWRPDNEEQKRGKFNHISVSIPEHPDFTVRLRGGYFKSAAQPILTTGKKSDKDPTKAREDDMRLVIDAPVSQRQITTELGLIVTQMPGVGTRVTATVEIGRDALAFESTDGKQVADLDIGGIFYDDKGKPVTSFVGRLKIYPLPADSSPAKRTQSIYKFHAWLPAGLYQVRVGVRDVKSGRIGSAMEWITVRKL
jgi:VWFA-related protein